MAPPLNRYTLLARVQPALLAALPLALLTLAWVRGGVFASGLLWALIVGAGGSVFLSHVARDQGRRKEPELFTTWGGAPTTRMLRHRDGLNDKGVLARRHTKLQKLLPVANGTGRVLAAEIMLATPGVRALIRDSKEHQLYSQIQTGGRIGMQTMAQSLSTLVISGRVSMADAEAVLSDPTELRSMVRAA